MAHERGWDVLVDAAAFAPTNRLDLARWQPDFVPLSFYKMFGYPTGMGCLLARKAALEKLVRPWYAGGTITISSVQGDGHYLVPGEAGFEDGTVNYLNIPAVEIGLRHLASIGLDVIHERVMCLTGWLIENLRAMRHATGQPLVKIHGPADLSMRGGTVTVTFFDRDGHAIDDGRIEQLANWERISLRTGCFCNPGAGEVAHGLTPEIMRTFFARAKAQPAGADLVPGAAPRDARALRPGCQRRARVCGPRLQLRRCGHVHSLRRRLPRSEPWRRSATWRRMGRSAPRIGTLRSPTV